MAISEGLKRCPNLVLVSGAPLLLYRQAWSAAAGRGAGRGRPDCAAGAAARRVYSCARCRGSRALVQGRRFLLQPASPAAAVDPPTWLPPSGFCLSRLGLHTCVSPSLPCPRSCAVTAAHFAWLQVPGEDLTPYRAASKAILSVLQRFGPAQRLGMDEVFVDVTRVSGQPVTHPGAVTCA